MRIDSTFLQRMANDPSSPIYNSSEAAGSFFYVPTSAQLNDAFSQVAGEILRLSK